MAEYLTPRQRREQSKKTASTKPINTEYITPRQRREIEKATQKVASFVSPEKVKSLMQPSKGLNSLPKISDTALNAKEEPKKNIFKKALDVNKYVGEATNAASAGALRTMSFGLSDKIINKVASKDAQANIQRVQSEYPIATKAGEFAGYVVPGVGAEMGVAKVGGKLLAKTMAKEGAKLTTKEAAKNFGKRSIIGGTAGAVVGGAESSVRGDSIKDIAKNTALGAGMGIVAEGAIAGAGKAIKSIVAKVKAKQPLTVAEKAIVEANPHEFKAPQDTPTVKADTVNPMEVKAVQNGVKTANINSKPINIFPDEGDNIVRYAVKDNNGQSINVAVPKEKFDKIATDIKDVDLLGNIDTARAKINYKPKEKSKFEGLFTKLRTQLVDRYAPLEKLEKGVRGKINSAESSLYKQARLFEGVPEKANLIIDTELKPIIKNIEAKGNSYKDLGLYAEMVHARDVNAAGMKSGFSDAEINDVIAKLGTKEMENARQQLMIYNDARLKSLVDGQLISSEQYNMIKEKWRNYMPLNRVFDDDKVDFVSNLGKSFVNVGKPIDKLIGSERAVIDPIESMIKNTYRMESAIGKNKVGLQLTDLAKEDSGNMFIRKIADNELTDRKNVVNITENGAKVKYEVQPEVYRALKNMDKESSNILVKVLQTPASILRAGATLTPEFAARNPIRDVFNAFIVSKSGFNPITDFAAGLGSYIRKGKLYEDFLKNNAGYGNIISLDRQTNRRVLETAIKQPVYKKFVTVINPKSWINVMRSISDATESATKIGEFRAALRSGATEQEAAYRARDLMDFGRAGTSVKELNKVVAFLNANIQGKSKFLRAIKENPEKVIPKLFVSMAAPSIGAYAAIHYFANDEQKQQIKDAPNWLRDSFWLIPIPGTDNVARVPKPFDAAAVSNTIERFLSYAIDNDKEAFDGFIKENVKQQAIPSMLTGITPILEGMTNYSFFRDAPIIPKREEYLQPQDQYDIYTSEISKFIAKGVQKLAPNSNFASPRIIDNTIRSTTAGLGGYVLEGTDKLLGKNKPAKNISQYPILKGFSVNENSSGKSMEFVYNEKDKLTKEKNSQKLKALNPKGYKYSKQKQLDYINDITEEINDISKEIRTIQNSNNLTAIEKRDKINVLATERNRITREAQQAYKVKW